MAWRSKMKESVAAAEPCKETLNSAARSPANLAESSRLVCPPHCASRTASLTKAKEFDCIDLAPIQAIWASLTSASVGWRLDRTSIPYLALKNDRLSTPVITGLLPIVHFMLSPKIPALILSQVL